MSYSSPAGDVKIKNLEKGVLLMQLLIFVLKMAPLVHIHTYIYNTAEQGWSNRGSVKIASSIGPVMWEIYLAARRQHIHASIGNALGEDNKIADTTSRLTHLPDLKFLSHFLTHSPPSKPWLLLTQPSARRWQLTTML